MMVTSSSSQRGRRHMKTPEELRAELVDAAMTIVDLYEEGKLPTEALLARYRAAENAILAAESCYRL